MESTKQGFDIVGKIKALLILFVMVTEFRISHSFRKKHSNSIYISGQFALLIYICIYMQFIFIMNYLHFLYVLGAVCIEDFMYFSVGICIIFFLYCGVTVMLRVTF